MQIYARLEINNTLQTRLCSRLHNNFFPVLQIYVCVLFIVCMLQINKSLFSNKYYYVYIGINIYIFFFCCFIEKYIKVICA